MNHTVHPIGNLVHVTAYGPFRGLKGTVLTVDQIADDPDDPFCFYLVALQGATIADPVWFEHHEVEFIGLPAEAVKSREELMSTMVV